MAKQQYRISSSGEWTSNYGYSFIALLNQSGSGRKLTIRQLSAFILSHKGNAAPTCTGRLFMSATPFVGEDMVGHATKLDSTATLPSTVVVRRGTLIPSFASPGHRFDLVRRGGAVGSQSHPLACDRNRQGARHLFGGAYNRGSTRSTTAIEPIVINQNEGVAVVAENSMTENQPVRVNVVVSVGGKTVVWDFVSVPMPGLAVFSLENTGATVVKLLSFSFAELGTSDTPFIRLVPIGQAYAQDLVDASKAAFTIEKMDSSYADLTALKVLADVGFIPSGSPEVVINEGSTGSPRGVNYLHTRDFNGPAYRVFLPEMRAGSGVSGSGMDMLGFANAHRGSDMLTRMNGTAREGITINPGEGLALVASSETFVGVQGAYSGWPALMFQAIIDSEATVFVTVNNLVTGSRVKVTRNDNSVVIFNGVESGGIVTFESTYTGAVTIEARKATVAPFYQPWVTVGTVGTGLTVTALQIAD